MKFPIRFRSHSPAAPCGADITLPSVAGGTPALPGGGGLQAAVALALSSASLLLAAPAARAEDAYVESLKANTVFTDYCANSATRIELDFEWLAGSYPEEAENKVTHGGMVIGPWSAGSGFATAFWNAGGDNGMQFIVGDNRKFVNSGRSISAARHFLVIDAHAGEVAVALHGATTTNVVDAAAAGATFAGSSAWPVSLLGAAASADGSSVDSGQFAKARIYGCRILEWNETTGEYGLVRNYVPVLRDGVAGLHDTVTDAFAVDPRPGAAPLAWGGDIEEVGHGWIQLVATSGSVGLNTGYKMKDTSRVELDGALGAASGVFRPMGCWNNGSATMRYLVYTASSKNQFFLNSSSSQGSGPAIDVNRHTWVFDACGNKGVFVTGSTTNAQITGTAPASGAVATYPLSVFADSDNASGTKWSQPAFGMKCFGLKIHENDVLVTNFVPFARRNGTFGFRDALTGAFLQADAANFVASPTVERESADAGDAYVQGDGSQVLNTGYHVTKNSRVEIEFAMTAPKRGFICGNYLTDASLNWSVWINSAGDRLQFSGIGSGSNNYIGSAPGTDRVKAVYDAKNLVGWIERAGAIDGDKTALRTDGSGREDSCRWPMGVFGGLKNANGTEVDTTLGANNAGGGIPMRVYSVRIYEGDAEEPAAEFLPYSGSEGVGLYDAKSGTFALKHSADVADPTIGNMGVDGSERWHWTPGEITVPADGSATAKANAVGAVARYVWTLGGETLEGEGESVSIGWRPGTRGLPVEGTVQAVYTVFGSEIAGAPQPFAATFLPKAFVLVVR